MDNLVYPKTILYHQMNRYDWAFNLHVTFDVQGRLRAQKIQVQNFLYTCNIQLTIFLQSAAYVKLTGFENGDRS